MKGRVNKPGSFLGGPVYPAWAVVSSGWIFIEHLLVSETESATLQTCFPSDSEKQVWQSPISGKIEDGLAKLQNQNQNCTSIFPAISQCYAA